MNKPIMAYRGRRTLLKVLPAAIMMGLAPCVYAAGSSATPALPAQSISQPQPQNSQSQSKNKQQQSATELGAIVVTGLRNSLESSMNVKRNAIGFVDAITAEAIGKFPDTNIAGALQRIPGVSINRRQGAGAQVTVRGFGPGFNMVLVDGRRVPGADAFGNGFNVVGGIGSGSRAFDFAELSPDDVNRLVVHKTGRANIDGGGIGATINIITDKPFFHEGGKVVANISGKGIYDTSEPFGNSITPAYSALLSYANPDKTWGVELNFNYMKRRGGYGVATENGWTTKPWTGSDAALRPGVEVQNPPKVGQLYSMPNDMQYGVTGYSTERRNGHIVFQLQPVDGLTITADDLFSRYKIHEKQNNDWIWLQRASSLTALKFNTGESVASPVFIRDVPTGLKDFPMQGLIDDQIYKLDSYGLNLKWQVNDDLVLALDGHESKNRSLPNDPVTGGGLTTVTPGGTNHCTSGPHCGGAFGQTITFNGGLPIAAYTWYPTQQDAYNNTNGTLNPAFGPNNIGTETAGIAGQGQVSDLKEIKFDGTLFFSQGKLQFGLSASHLKMHAFAHDSPGFQLGHNTVNDAGKFPDLMGFLTPMNILSHFDGYPTQGAMGANWYRSNPDQLFSQWIPKHYPSRTTIDPALSSDNTVQERTQAAYAQITINASVGNFPATMRFGMRYLRTRVSALSFQATPSFRWDSNNDFSTLHSSTLLPVSSHGSYSNLLPNVDFNIQLTDSLVGRASFSKTIARPGFGNLYAGASVGAPSGATLVNSTFRATGSAGNTGLNPLKSNNFDIGMGWYFAPASYISATFWYKRVDNFIGNGVTTENLFGVQDMTSGPRAQKAEAFLASAACKAQVAAAGFGGTGACSLNNTSLFTAVALMQDGNGGLAAYDGSPAQQAKMVTDEDVLAQPGDPLYQFDVSRPVNKNNAHMHGWEFGGQYFFGKTGIGVLANYTIAKQNIGVKPDSSPTVNQFAVTGLSNSANIVAMYQKYGWSVRLAWAWRGHYLLALNQNGSSRNPLYVDPYHELDLGITYEFNKHLSCVLSGINLTGEDVRWYERSQLQVVRLVDQKPRYALAVRYHF